MSKYFDKESLLDCMYTLNKKANIDHEGYKIWYKLNENARISVKTSVGDSKSKKVKDSIGRTGFRGSIISILTKSWLCN